jgi:hypothetical protein
VYSRADLSRTLAFVIALFLSAISMSALARQFGADTIEQTRGSAIDLDCTRLE